MKDEKYQIDEERTAELHLPGVLVVKDAGDENNFICVLNQVDSRPRCPYCGCSALRNQGTMHRKYMDAILRDGEPTIISVEVEFGKYKCLSAECGHVFYPEFSFASPYARTTHRIDDAIARLVLEEGYSYEEISREFSGRISRQVIGQIFHRRVEELEKDSSLSSGWYHLSMRDYSLRSWKYWKGLNRREQIQARKKQH